MPAPDEALKYPINLRVALGPDEADAFIRRAEKNDRLPQHEALRIIRERLIADGDLKDPRDGHGQR